MKNVGYNKKLHSHIKRTRIFIYYTVFKQFLDATENIRKTYLQCIVWKCFIDTRLVYSGLDI